MKRLAYYTVDVFAENKYEGNPLAVFRNAGGLSTEEMQRIAKEMNLSETSFILSDELRDGGYDVRIFTPDVELPFAGHPTLGTAYVIREFLLGGSAETVVLNLKVGPIPVTLEADGVQWMKQNAPVIGGPMSREPFAAMLGLDLADLDDRYPIQKSSTGTPSYIVPLRSLDAVRRARVKRELYDVFTQEVGTHTLLVFAPEAYSSANQLNARVFCDCMGIPEDPATGSAAGNLCGYLVRNRYFGGSAIDIRMEQGYEIGRPSLLFLKAAETENGSVDIRVGGRSVPVARGEWL